MIEDSLYCLARGSQHRLVPIEIQLPKCFVKTPEKHKQLLQFPDIRLGIQIRDFGLTRSYSMGKDFVPKRFVVRLVDLSPYGQVALEPAEIFA